MSMLQWSGDEYDDFREAKGAEGTWWFDTDHHRGSRPVKLHYKPRGGRTRTVSSFRNDFVAMHYAQQLENKESMAKRWANRINEAEGGAWSRRTLAHITKQASEHLQDWNDFDDAWVFVDGSILVSFVNADGQRVFGTYAQFSGEVEANVVAARSNPGPVDPIDYSADVKHVKASALEPGDTVLGDRDLNIRGVVSSVSPPSDSGMVRIGIDGGYERGIYTYRNTVFRVLKKERPRVNPAPSSRAVTNARKTWSMWHKKDEPRSERTLSVKLLDEKHFVPIGKAEEILYASDKWEKDGDVHDYVHDFESHPKVFIPSSKARDGEAIGAPKSTLSLLGVKARPNPLPAPQLATVQALSYRDANGDLVDVAVGRGAKLLSTPDKKGLIIVTSSGPILVRGGQMRVTARGIVK
jgi:hypothetical protein